MKRFDGPVLRVVGEQTIPRFLESDALLAEWLPQSERSTIPTCGHFLQVQDPGPVAEALVTFLERHPLS